MKGHSNRYRIVCVLKVAAHVTAIMVNPIQDMITRFANKFSQRPGSCSIPHCISCTACKEVDPLCDGPLDLCSKAESGQQGVRSL